MPMVFRPFKATTSFGYNPAPPAPPATPAGEAEEAKPKPSPPPAPMPVDDRAAERLSGLRDVTARRLRAP